ncbi:MAG TPA: GYD domain-containing protein [Acidobacteriota bacterium]|nr:GYD domain-containing protein [Acidobacteriota bacterium]
MPTFALLTKLSPETTANLDSKEEMGRTWYSKIKQSCPGVRWLHHFAILGPYDFMDIYEAENEEEAAKVSMVTLANGAAEAINWTLIPYQRYLAMIKDLESKGVL